MLQKEDGNRNQYAALPDVNNYTVDFCSHLNSYTTALFFRAFSTGLQKYGNMFHSCPFSVCIFFFLDKMKFDQLTH